MTDGSRLKSSSCVVYLFFSLSFREKTKLKLIQVSNELSQISVEKKGSVKDFWSVLEVNFLFIIMNLTIENLIVVF